MRVIWEGNDGKKADWRVMFWLIAGLLVGFIVFCLVVDLFT